MNVSSQLLSRAASTTYDKGFDTRSTIMRRQLGPKRTELVHDRNGVEPTVLS